MVGRDRSDGGHGGGHQVDGRRLTFVKSNDVRLQVLTDEHNSIRWFPSRKLVIRNQTVTEVY